MPDSLSRRFTRPASLTRRIGALAIATISGTTFAIAWSVSHLFADHMIGRDAELTMMFVQSAVGADRPERYFDRTLAPDVDALNAYLQGIARQPEVLRANAYDRAQRLLWSSDANLIGKSFADNSELTRALAGELVFKLESHDAHKEEHEQLATGPTRGFVETYVPLRASDQDRRVVGVIEVYRSTDRLLETIAAGKSRIWLISSIGGIFVFAMLYWAMRRADRLLERQRDELLETQALAIVGELGRAVVHSVRSPLAAIRSSAELCLQGAAEPERASLDDIVRESDRIDGLLRELLTFTPDSIDASPVASLDAVIGTVVQDFDAEARRRAVRVRLQLESEAPEVHGHPRLLYHAISSVLANALEASSPGGEVTITVRHDKVPHEVELALEDHGVGMSADAAERAFEPFFTTKHHGLGIGLALVRHVVAIFHGRVALQSRPGRGTRVVFRFKAAS